MFFMKKNILAPAKLPAGLLCNLYPRCAKVRPPAFLLRPLRLPGQALFCQINGGAGPGPSKNLPFL